MSALVNTAAAGTAGTALRKVAQRVSRMHEITGMLRNSIVVGELAPNSLHSVGSLAETIGVSRTPVREALIESAARGLVRFERNRGVRILQPTRADMADIYEVRRLLEAPIMGKVIEAITPAGLAELTSILDQADVAAAEHDELREWELDREFHYVLLMQSGNRYIADYLDQLRDKIFVRRTTTAGAVHHPGSVGGDHRTILRAIEDRDVPAAEDAVLKHIERSQALYGQ